MSLDQHTDHHENADQHGYEDDFIGGNRARATAAAVRTGMRLLISIPIGFPFFYKKQGTGIPLVGSGTNGCGHIQI